MKQKLGSNNCFAVAAAMALKMSVEEVESELLPAIAPYSDRDIYKLMLNNGYVCGFIAEYPEGNKQLTINSKIGFIHPISEIEAFIIVRSETYEYQTHAIYWDMEDVHDPNPNTSDGRRLDTYTVLNIIPIHKL